jgi:hypothetical protein
MRIDWITLQTQHGRLIWMIRTLSASFKTHSSRDSLICFCIPFILPFFTLKLTDAQPFTFESRIVVDRPLYETPGLTFWWIVDESQVRGQPNYTQRCKVYQLSALQVPPISNTIKIDQRLLSLIGLHDVDYFCILFLDNGQESHKALLTFVRFMGPSGYFRSIARLVATNTNLPIVPRDQFEQFMRFRAYLPITNEPYFISNENENELCQTLTSFHTNIRLLTQESGYCIPKESILTIQLPRTTGFLLANSSACRSITVKSRNLDTPMSVRFALPSDFP